MADMLVVHIGVYLLWSSPAIVPRDEKTRHGWILDV